MSSDGFMDDFSLDAAAFEQLDAIEAAHFSLPKPSVSENHDLDKLEDTDEGQPISVAGPSNHSQKNLSGRTVQTTLFGSSIPPTSRKNKNTAPSQKQPQRSQSNPRNPFGQQAKRSKVWDHTEFAKTGWKRSKSKTKAQETIEDNDEGEEEEAVEFEQFPAPVVPVGPPPPMKLKADLLEAKHWIYPLNQPKRDYQFNIVKHCLFDNTLVSLPTGLGKTFIAGCVMLNYYRWFPDGKVVFVAPTKPLVAQQIEACHRVCGIPGSHAVELTGNNPRAMRSREWVEKKVFYMTPQTLINDLITENCDPRDIILLVIDEAHKAKGDYAYAQVVRYLMAKSSHFRVLALTATPGGTPEAVQDIVDACHISRIEIRDEDSLDLKEYLHHKDVKQHIIAMSDDINKVKNILVRLMDETLKPLCDNGVMYGWSNTAYMSAFLPQSIMRKIDKSQRWAYAPLSKLSSLARALGYLMEGTISMCYTYVHEIADNKCNGDEKKSARAAKLRADPTFQTLLHELELQHARGFSVHPKMEMLKSLVIQYLGQRMTDGERGNEEQTRVMVFVTFRSAVEEIIEYLDSERPLIRAVKFVGQGTDKQGKRGFAQKQQLEVLRKFKAGEFNVLVATSIGEEGLDIGEVDMIICYDAQKTPLRMLQRLGRTGRQRDGYVHVLLAEGREELNMDKAKATYKEVQKTIVRGEQLELYGDVERLLPEHIKPACLERVMDVEPYVREEPKKRMGMQSLERSPPNGKKRKRNDDITRNIPAGASTGFVSVIDLLEKGKRKEKGKERAGGSKKTKVVDIENSGDEIGAEIGASTGLLRRTVSANESIGKTVSERRGKKARTTRTMETNKPTKNMGRPSLYEPTSSQCADDSDDLDIERGLIATRPIFGDDPPKARLPLDANTVVEISSDSDASAHSGGWNVPSPHSNPRSPLRYKDVQGCQLQQEAQNRQNHENSMAWLVDDDDDDSDVCIIDSSPSVSHKRPSILRAISSEVEVVPPSNSKPPSMSSLKLSPTETKKSSPERSAKSPTIDGPPSPLQAMSLRKSSQSSVWEAFPEIEVSSLCNNMPENTHPDSHSNGTVEKQLESSSPVRARPPRRPLKEQVLPDTSTSPPKPSPSQRRLHRVLSPAIARPAKSKTRNAGVTVGQNPLLDLEAEHSGDEVSEGSSGVSEEMDGSDKQFLRELPETQVSPSYNQALAYRESLMSQAPTNSNGPVFTAKPLRRGPFGRLVPNAKRNMVSSSPTRADCSEDAYAVGTFVVDDEAELSYEGPSSD